MPVSHAINPWENFPGWELIAEGLVDVSAARVTPAACAIWIALPRLRRAHLVDDGVLDRRIEEPETVLYRLLRKEGGDAFSRYNAILRRLVRFEHALDRGRHSDPRQSLAL